MPTIPPSIGDEAKTVYKIIQETFPLPGNRKDVLSAVGSILAKGGVQKLVVQLGEPIKVARAVQSDDVGPDEEPLDLIVEDSLYDAARNASIEDLGPRDELSAYEYLFHAFLFLEKNSKKIYPYAFAVRSIAAVEKWLNLKPGTIDFSLYGVTIKQDKNIPEGVMLLLADTEDQPGLIALSLRLEIT